MKWYRPIQDIAIGIAFKAIAEVITPRNKALFIEIINTFDSQDMNQDDKIDTVQRLWRRIRKGETVPVVTTLDDTRL